MATHKAPEAGWRGSRELWLAAAYDALVESGVDDVRVQPLGKRLGLSRTSFYWFFTDREALLGALLDLWRDRNSAGLIGRAAAYAETVAEAVLNVTDCWLDPALFDSALEFAVRSWALRSADVGEEIGRADAARIAAFAALFARFGFEAAEAGVRARAMYLTQIGYISMKAEEDLALRLERVPHYVEIFTGARATASELARFRARHVPSGSVGLGSRAA